MDGQGRKTSCCERQRGTGTPSYCCYSNTFSLRLFPDHRRTSRSTVQNQPPVPHGWRGIFQVAIYKECSTCQSIQQCLKPSSVPTRYQIPDTRYHVPLMDQSPFDPPHSGANRNIVRVPRMEASSIPNREEGSICIHSSSSNN